SPEIAQLGEVASQGLGLLFLKFGRDDERESDRLGVEYSTKIGYDAKEMADFFTTLERASASSGAAAIPDFLSTHPNPGDPHVTVNQLATEWKQKQNLSNAKVSRESYLKLIDGIVYGEDPRQGFVENQVFYHPELKFRFPVPSGWQYQNSPQQFQMAPKDGKALMTLSLAAGNSLEAAAQDMVQKNKLTVVESRQVTVNGLPAMAVIADQVPDPQQQQQQQAEPIRTLTYFIQYGGNIYRIMGISRTADFNTYATMFSNTMQNFMQLTEADKLNRTPDRVRIKTVAQNTTLGQALRSYQVPENKLEQVAILNGMQLNDPLSKGTQIKVIGK
ncbi:MAG TPA: M48 family metalloprotease, partial [Adhaeribacter sp.]|nr:M48 family metalloprotease [Adhaeribacter sp.]